MAKQFSWVRDEIILVLDAYYDLECHDGGAMPPASHPRVIELSQTLKALGIHPVEDRLDKFRNPPGVALKFTNLRAAEREVRLALGEAGAEDFPLGMRRGGRRDREVFEEFYGDRERLADEAAAILEATEDRPSAPLQDSPTASDAPIDGGGVARSQTSHRFSTRSANRSEADLVERYADYLDKNGHEVTGRHYAVPEQSRPLRADLFVKNLNVLVEAKSTTDRNAVRLAIGQLLDYRRFETPRPRCAILVPERPGEDIRGLLAELSIACVYPYADRFVAVGIDELA